MAILILPYQDSQIGSAGGWLCGQLACSILNNGLTFQAITEYTAFATASGCDHSTGCYLSNVVITDLDAESPTPVPTPMPTPTPIPVSKVFFVPGMGASWNADAFASCSFDNNPTHWSLASYAEDIYNPLKTALENTGWNVLPFYYDWRAKVASNSSALSDAINNGTSNGEKVNIVSHSMGGLVASDYLTHDQGAKINSLLAIGSPLKGAVQAYPAWSGGDIWQDNFLAKIATTLYLKHCGGVLSNDRETVQRYVPSVQDLLPTFNYLKFQKTNTFKSFNSMIAQNGWLPLGIIDGFWGIKFGTLTGNNFDTLSEIPIKEPNKRDISLGNWIDGKPAGKTTTLAGDGTVLLSSSKLDDAHNITINQLHAGLVSSIEGMSEILSFLGTPPTTTLSSTFIEPTSALVIIGYPSNFWVTDQNGNTRKDKDGMIAFVNPKNGNYKVNVFPKTGKTFFIVAQFLPNGETKYKEYKFEGLAPKFKTLKFDALNPTDDILN